MLGHPVKEPLVRLILDVDFDVDKQTLTDQRSETTDTSLAESRECAETSETEAGSEERIGG